MYIIYIKHDIGYRFRKQQLFTGDQPDLFVDLDHALPIRHMPTVKYRVYIIYIHTCQTVYLICISYVSNMYL